MSPICPYCRTPIEEDEVPECPDCGVPHHLECWFENNGCSIPGCSQAPQHEPKASVTPPARGRQAEVRRNALAGYAVSNGVSVIGVEQYSAKNRNLFMVLGLFLGPFGIHNFYAGYTVRGALQLGLTCSTLFYGAVLTWCWAIVEILVVSRDAGKRPME